jgi:hypothetical protein
MNDNKIKEGWSNDITSRNRRHYYKYGKSLCGKATVKHYMRVFDTESTGDKYSYDCSICINKLKELKS